MLGIGWASGGGVSGIGAAVEGLYGCGGMCLVSLSISTLPFFLVTIWKGVGNE